MNPGAVPSASVDGTNSVELVVGRIGKAHGLTGEVGVEVRTDDPTSRFALGSKLRVGAPPTRTQVAPSVFERTVTVARTRWANGRLLVTFEGIGDRTAAETLRGKLISVFVNADERPRDPDEFFDHHLVGCTVVLEDGSEVGTVTEVLHLPAQDVLQVKRSTGEVLVPFVAAIVPTVDLSARRIVLTPPVGLLDESGDGEVGA